MLKRKNLLQASANKSLDYQIGWILLIVSSGRVVTMALGFVTTILLVHNLSATDYASYAVAFGFVSIQTLVSLYGSETTITRDSAAALESGDLKKAQIAASSDIYSTIFLSVIVSSVTLCIVLQFDLLPEMPMSILLLCAVWTVAMSVNRVTGEWLRGAKKVFAATMLNGQGPFGGLLNSVLILAIIFYLSQIDSINLQSVIITSIIAYVVSSGIGLMIGISQIGLASVDAALKHRLKNLKSSLFIYIAQVFQFATSQHTYILLASVIFDAKDVAILAVSLRLFAFASAALVTVNQASSEIIVRLYIKRDLAGLERVVRLASSTTVVASLVITIGLIGLTPAGFELVFGSQYRDAYWLSSLFMLSAIVNGLGGLSMRVLSLTGYVEAALYAQACASIAVFALSVPLGLAFGIYGFAIGCVLAGIVQRGIAGRVSLKHLGIRCYAYLSPKEYYQIGFEFVTKISGRLARRKK